SEAGTRSRDGVPAVPARRRGRQRPIQPGRRNPSQRGRLDASCRECVEGAAADPRFDRGVTMGFFDTKQQRASWVVAILGLLIVIALAPYASGLLGAPVLYILMAPLYEWLLRRLKSRRIARALVIV